MEDENTAEGKPLQPGVNEEGVFTQDEVAAEFFAARSSGDRETMDAAVVKQDKLFEVWQQGYGESLDGKVKLAKAQAEYYKQIELPAAALIGINDVMDMLEQEGTDEARELFNQLADEEEQLRDPEPAE